MRSASSVTGIGDVGVGELDEDRPQREEDDAADRKQQSDCKIAARSWSGHYFESTPALTENQGKSIKCR